MFHVEQFLNLFDKYGLPALMLGVLCWYIWQKDKMHKEETSKLTAALNRMAAAVEKSFRVKG